MGRLIGKRPDDTRRIARRISRFLEPGEQVLAAIHVQRPGTLSAGLQGGASGAVGATVDAPPTPPEADGKQSKAWQEQTERAGIGVEEARRSTRLYLVLTASRLMLVRRSRLLQWRPREVVAAWTLEEIDRIRVSPHRQAVTIDRGTGSMTFEFPVALKFLPDVYRELPTIHDHALNQGAR